MKQETVTKVMVSFFDALPCVCEGKHDITGEKTSPFPSEYGKEDVQTVKKVKHFVIVICCRQTDNRKTATCAVIFVRFHLEIASLHE